MGKQHPVPLQLSDSAVLTVGPLFTDEVLRSKSFGPGSRLNYLSILLFRTYCFFKTLEEKKYKLNPKKKAALKFV